jgi:Lrp/AsnC family leucine-responsive transcriptional regulator
LEGFKVHDEKLLDDAGVQILRNLQENARISFSELGRAVGLSSPAVAERVRRLEETGYIKGYRAIVAPEKIGFPITAYVNMRDGVYKLKDMDDIIGTTPEIVEMHHLSGSDGIMLKVLVSSVVHLESVLNKLNNFGETTTSILLSSPVSSHALERFSDKKAAPPLQTAHGAAGKRKRA